MVRSRWDPHSNPDHYPNPTMTTNTEPMDDSIEYREMPEDSGYSPEDMQRDGTAQGYRPIPGMDILTVVYNEAKNRAQKGVPPAYAFLRIDIYLLAQAANSATGVMNWVDASIDLNCYILPLLPGEDQAPFILCSNLDEASQVLIGSFPIGTFTEVPQDETSQVSAEDDSSATADGCPVNDTAPIVTEVVETTDG